VNHPGSQSKLRGFTHVCDSVFPPEIVKQLLFKELGPNLAARVELFASHSFVYLGSWHVVYLPTVISPNRKEAQEVVK
jgi:hypothetical protein